ncbi:MAG: YafY family protein [Paracoccaceae bacterium]
MSENGSGDAEQMRLFRLFRLLDQMRLRTHPITAFELSGLMDVSVRTIYRDIADLQALGAPIKGEGGIGYVMEKGFFMPSLNFDNDELEALALGAKLVAARAGDGLAGAARRASSKIASAIGENSRLGFLNTPLEAGPSAAASNTETGELQDSLRAAIHGRNKLEITYQSLSDKTSVRTARPLGLTVFDSVWLLTIWCEKSDGFRHLRLDRIISVGKTGKTFRHEKGRQFADALAHKDR